MLLYEEFLIFVQDCCPHGSVLSLFRTQSHRGRRHYDEGFKCLDRTTIGLKAVFPGNQAPVEDDVQLKIPGHVLIST